MNNLSKITIAIALLGCAASTSSMAQSTYNPSWYIMPSVDYINPDDRFQAGNGVGVGLHFGKAIAPSWDLQMGATHSRAKNDTRSYDTTTLGVDALFMFSRSNFRPFLLVGGGAERDTARGQTNVAPYLNAGLGFQYSFSDQWFMQADVRRVHGFQKTSNFAFRSIDNNVATIGISYLFDKPAGAPRAVTPPPPAPVVVQAAPVQPAPARFEKITLSATELFEFNRSELRMPQPKLDEIARVLSGATLNENLVITGHTDRIGSDQYNQKLSQDRANAVKDYLVSKGAPANRLSAQGKGESQPVVTCNNKNRAALIKCLEPNRRVEVEQITIERQVK